MTSVESVPDREQHGKAALLTIRGLQKIYGGNVALDRVDLEVHAGEIHALLGENGAGKSTLIKCLAGVEIPDQGTITLLGENYDPSKSSNSRIEFIHQQSSLVEDLSIAENIAFSVGFPRRFGLIDWTRSGQLAVSVLDRMRVVLDPFTPVAELSQANRTVVAIARALAQDARVIVLDEPTANLSEREATTLFSLLENLRGQGVGVIFVSHHLDEVVALCDKATVFRDGKTVISGEQMQSLTREDLIEAITGERPNPLENDPQSQRIAANGEGLRLIDVEGELVGPLSMEFNPGEIVGITGLADCGHHQLGELIFGIGRMLGGRMEFLGNPYQPNSPEQAIARGVGYVPPDRELLGLAEELSIVENLFLNPRADDELAGKLGFLDKKRESARAKELIEEFSINPPVPELTVSSLSGGNAQKVLIARWLRQSPDLVILNDLTVGVDVGARRTIYSAVRRAAERGMAVIVVTSDFEEVAALCDRTYLMRDGSLCGELTNEVLTVESISSIVGVGKVMA